MKKQAVQAYSLTESTRRDWLKRATCAFAGGALTLGTGTSMAQELFDLDKVRASGVLKERRGCGLGTSIGQRNGAQTEFVAF